MKIAFAALVLTLLAAPAAQGQQPSDSDSFEQGQQLYQVNCVLCHKDSGAGDPPAFPPLNASEQLADLAHVVANIRQGKGNMPAFPELNTEQISSLANYIRNAWQNDYDRVTTVAVAAVLEGLERPEGSGQIASILAGVYTEAQAIRGEDVYEGACGSCHGRRLNGAPDDPDMRSAPPLARAKFFRNWEGRSLATLFEYTRATMPEDNPGSLTDAEYVDVIAHMLSVSNIPTGSDELRPNPQSLARAIIHQQ